ncbi:uncharacterized protein LOC117720945 [Arvicanthis niloticus]|uniref:uncharacterized protein LOC117720945 n=1 Tax=Arvicanthis niloticus TaxID=61156 RepID=UPI00402B5142
MTWARPMGARGWGRSQTRKAVGAGSRDDNLSSPLRDELGHALLVAPAPPPREALRVALGPSRSASSSCPRGGGGAGTCRSQARRNHRAAEDRLVSGPAPTDPRGARSAICRAGRGLGKAHSALLVAEGSGSRGYLSSTRSRPRPKGPQVRFTEK